MFLKIGIIAGVLVLGGFIFSAEIQSIFPNTTTTTVNSLETDVKTLTSTSIITAEKKISSSVKEAETKISEIGHKTAETAEGTINSSVEKVGTKLSEFKQNSTQYVEETIDDNFSFLNSNK